VRAAALHRRFARAARLPHRAFASGIWQWAARVSAVAVLTSAASCGRSGPSARERATSMAREHREPDAVRLLRDELVRHPDDIASRRLLVRVLALQGDLGAAAREAAALAERLGDHDPLPFIELGHAYELAHRFERALEMYDSAASLAKADARGPREGGMRAARWGELEWARPRLEEAVRRGGRDAELWHALGLVRLHAGDARAAEEAYRAGLQADRSAWRCHLGLATIAVQKRDGQAALLAYEAILALRPAFAPAHLGRAWALGQLGRKDEALVELLAAEASGAGATYVAEQRRALAARRPDAAAARGDRAPNELAPPTIVKTE
jgi:tetratricopeptide (TPR) repeat protein